MNLAILLAAGSSTRAGQNKLWAEVLGEPLWFRSYKTFLEHPSIDHIIVVVTKGEEFKFLPFVEAKKTEIITGAETRMGSFKCGLKSFRPLTDSDLILDHNAANPLVTPKEISDVIAAAKKSGAAAVAHAVVDTVAEVDIAGGLVGFKERQTLRLMQTPQAVRGDILKKVDLCEATDLSSALIAHTKVQLLPAHPLNKKITFAEDVEVLKALLEQNVHSHLGEDSHPFSKQGELSLGGLKVPDCPALLANSDGDVMVHAIGRALAVAQGKNFSEAADALCEKGEKDSRTYLQPFLKGLKLLEVSLVLEGARPRVDPLCSALKKSLSQLLSLPEDRITLTAHTGEALTSFGRGEGLRCLALVKTIPK